MASIQRLLLFTVALSSLAVAAPVFENSSYNSSACQELKRRYSNLTSFPGSNEYVSGVAENWSETCVEPAYCLFEPTTASDVAGALTILKATNTKFAVRGGGHMPVPEAASITKGVLISTENLQTMRLSDDRQIAQLGPGLRWGAVYQWISQYNLAVVGGRYSPVGVPGLLLGGGINYFGSQYGWASNMVANFEVVLANSSIVDANAETNPDLYWALKGGSSNFGIITRFDLKTFPVTTIYGGTTIYEPDYVDEYLSAIAEYATPGGGSDDILGSINPSLQIDPSTGIFTISSISSHVGPEPNPAAFANFTRIPTNSTNNGVRANFSAFSDETSSPVFSERSNRWLFSATSLKATPEAVYLTNQTFFETMASMPELKNIPGLSLVSTQQTITKAWLEAARASGGDAIDLDPANGNFIEYLINARWDRASDDELVEKWARRCIANTDAAAKRRGLYYPFVYLNDAAGSQEIFRFYGGGKSLPRMRAIARRYDPSGVFQTLMPGGFKIFSN